MEPRRKGSAIAGPLAAVAFDFIGGIGAGAFLGFYLDRWLATEPWLLIVCTLLGTGGGFIRMIQILRHFQRSRARNDS